MDQIKCMFGTGHRPFTGQHDIAHPYRQQIREHLLNTLYRSYLFGGYNTYMFGGSTGFDHDFALTVIRMKQELKGGVFLIAALPFSDMHSQWSNDIQYIHLEILEQCDQVVCVSPPGYEKSKYMKRNMYMVDNSDEGICFWKGGSGGTRNTIRYCLQKGKRVANLLQYDVNKALQA